MDVKGLLGWYFCQRFYKFRQVICVALTEVIKEIREFLLPL
jgi:hypothetical protein